MSLNERPNGLQTLQLDRGELLGPPTYSFNIVTLYFTHCLLISLDFSQHFLHQFGKGTPLSLWLCNLPICITGLQLQILYQNDCGINFLGESASFYQRLYQYLPRWSHSFHLAPDLNSNAYCWLENKPWELACLSVRGHGEQRWQRPVVSPRPFIQRPNRGNDL